MIDVIEIVEVRRLSPKPALAFVLAAIAVTSLAILFDIPVLRQVLWLPVYLVLPGAIILILMRANRIGPAARFALSIGLSLAFLMIFGLLIDFIYYSLGYQTPLSTASLVYSFGAVLTGLSLLAYRVNRDAFGITVPKLHLRMPAPMLFIIPLAFPLLAILGANILDITSNNIVLVFLLSLIALYILLMFLKVNDNPRGLYPWALFCIGLALIFMYTFRGEHIMGQDIHLEYFVFQQTFAAQHLFVGQAYIESCLGVTLLPSVFQSLSGGTGEVVMKYFYPLVLIVTPLAIYFISRRYLKEPHAFLAAFFFMAQTPFYRIVSLRDMLATMFVALAIMVIFSKEDKMGLMSKRALFLVMVTAVVVSHYATSLMFVLLLIPGWLLASVIIRRSVVGGRHVSLYATLFAVVGIFIWQSQIWGRPFEAGMWYIRNTFNYLADFYFLESRSGIAQQFITGTGTSLPNTIQLYLMYLTIALMAVGIVWFVVRRKATITEFSPWKSKDNFLEAKVDLEYVILGVIAFIMLVVQVALPFISTSYNLGRSYMVALVFLPLLFVAGGAQAARWLRLKPLVLLLLVLLPYFLFTSGLAYQFFGVPRGVHLNSTGDEFYRFYVYDQEYYATDWLAEQYLEEDPKPVYGDQVGVEERLKDKIPYEKLRVLEPDQGESYLESLQGSFVYLTYDNVTRGQMGVRGGVPHDISEYSQIFDSKNRVYTNGGSEVYR